MVRPSPTANTRWITKEHYPGRKFEAIITQFVRIRSSEAAAGLRRTAQRLDHTAKAPAQRKAPSAVVTDEEWGLPETQLS